MRVETALFTGVSPAPSLVPGIEKVLNSNLLKEWMRQAIHICHLKFMWPEDLDYCERLLYHSGLCALPLYLPEVMIKEWVTDGRLTLGIPLPWITNWTPSKGTALSSTGIHTSSHRWNMSIYVVYNGLEHKMKWFKNLFLLFIITDR